MTQMTKMTKITNTNPTKEFTIPYKWWPRPYQIPVWKAMTTGGFKTAVMNNHRRTGKDLVCFNIAVWHALQPTPGQYWHVYPTFTQGRRALWDNITNKGVKYLSFIPNALIANKNEKEMKLTFLNGSTYQVIGTEAPDRLVGTNPKGIIMSEYSIQNPEAYELIRPILQFNKGWIIFNFTPKGKNHAFKLFNRAKQDPDIYCESLTIDDTGLMTKHEVEQAKLAGMDEGKIKSEYYCSFEGSVVGSYYGKIIDQLYENDQIGGFPYDPAYPVHTAWDLGYSDTTVIICFQCKQREVHVIDYIALQTTTLPDCIHHVKAKKYRYDRHFAPHDIAVHEFSIGKSRRQVARELGFNFEVCPKISLEEGLEQVRSILPRCFFNERNTDKLITALREYRRTYDPNDNVYSKNPLHDWTSHYADAFRYLAIAVNKSLRANYNAARKNKFAITHYDVLSLRR